MPTWLSGFREKGAKVRMFDPDNLLPLARELDSDTLDRWSQLQQIHSRTAQESGDRNLRQLYGKVILGLLILQFLFVVTVVFLLGFGVVTLDRWVATASLGGTSGVSGMAYLTVRYLFPPPFRG